MTTKARNRITGATMLVVLGANGVATITSSVQVKATDSTHEIPSSWVNSDGSYKFGDKDSIEYLLNNIYNAKGELKTKVSGFVGLINVSVYGVKTSVKVAADGSAKLAPSTTDKDLYTLNDAPASFDDLTKAIVTAIKSNGADNTKLTFFNAKSIDSQELTGVTAPAGSDKVDMTKSKAVYNIKATVTKNLGNKEDITPLMSYADADTITSDVLPAFAKLDGKTYLGTKQVLDLDKTEVEKHAKDGVVTFDLTSLSPVKLNITSDLKVNKETVSKNAASDLLAEDEIIPGIGYDSIKVSTTPGYVNSVTSSTGAALPYTIKDGQIVFSNLATDGTINIKGGSEGITKSDAKTSLSVEGTWKDSDKADANDALKAVTAVIPSDANNIKVTIGNQTVVNKPIVTDGSNLKVEVPQVKTLSSYVSSDAKNVDVTIEAGSYKETKTISIASAEKAEPKTTDTKTPEIAKEAVAPKAKATTFIKAKTLMKVTSRDGHRDADLYVPQTATSDDSTSVNAGVVTQGDGELTDINESLLHNTLTDTNVKFKGYTQYNNNSDHNKNSVWLNKDQAQVHVNLPTEGKIAHIEGVRAYSIGDVNDPDTMEHTDTYITDTDSANLNFNALAEGTGHAYMIRYFGTDANGKYVYTPALNLLSTVTNYQDENGNFVNPVNGDTDKLGKDEHKTPIIVNSDTEVPSASVNVKATSDAKDIADTTWYTKFPELTLSGKAKPSLTDAKLQADALKSVKVRVTQLYHADTSSYDEYTLVDNTTTKDAATGSYDSGTITSLDTLNNILKSKYQEGLFSVQVVTENNLGATTQDSQTFGVSTAKPKIANVDIDKEPSKDYKDMFNTNRDFVNLVNPKLSTVTIRMQDKDVDSPVINFINENHLGDKVASKTVLKLHRDGDDGLQFGSTNTISIIQSGVYSVSATDPLGVTSDKKVLGTEVKSSSDTALKGGLFIFDAKAPLYDDSAKPAQMGTYKNLPLYNKAWNFEAKATDTVEQNDKYGAIKTVSLFNPFASDADKKNLLTNGWSASDAQVKKSLFDVDNKLDSADAYTKDKTVSVGIKDSDMAVNDQVFNYDVGVADVNNNRFITSSTASKFYIDDTAPKLDTTKLADEANSKLTVTNGELHFANANTSDLELLLKGHDVDSKNANYVTSGLKGYEIFAKKGTSTATPIKSGDYSEGKINAGNASTLNGKILYVVVTDAAGNKSAPISLSELLGKAPDLPIVLDGVGATGSIDIDQSTGYNGWFAGVPDKVTFNGNTQSGNLTDAKVSLEGGDGSTYALKNVTGKPSFSISTKDDPELAKFLAEQLAKVNQRTDKVNTIKLQVNGDTETTATFKLDNVNPVGNFDVDKTIIGSNNDYANHILYYSTNQPVAGSSVSDIDSGVAKVTIFGKDVNGNEVKQDAPASTTNPNFTIPRDWLNVTRLEVIDNVGNKTEYTSPDADYKYIYDSAKPVVKSNLDTLKADYTTKAGQKWFKNKPDYIVTATDETYLEQLDFNLKQNMSQETISEKERLGKLSSVQTGENEINVNAKDKIPGHVTNFSEKVYVDLEKPYINPDYNSELLNQGKDWVVNSGPIVAKANSLTLNTSFLDADSGVQKYELERTDADGHKDIVATVTPSAEKGVSMAITESGAYSLLVTDNVGNVTRIELKDLLRITGNKDNQIIFDKEAPKVDIKGTGDAIKDLTEGSVTKHFSKSKVHITAKFSDMSAMNSRQVYINGVEVPLSKVKWTDSADFKTATAEFDIDLANRDSQGQVIVSAEAEDEAGNKMKDQAVPFFFDMVAPHVDDQVITGTHIVQADKNTTLFKDKVSVALTVSDINAGEATSGIDKVTIYKDGKLYKELDPKAPKFDITESGTYTVKTSDKMGNVSKEYTITDANKFKKQDVKPALTIKGFTGANNATPITDPSKRVKDNAKIDIKAVADTINVKKLDVTVNGKPLVTRTQRGTEALDADVSFETKDQPQTANGTYTVVATATDEFDNQIVQTVTYNVDKSVPVINLNTKPAIFHDKDGAMVVDNKIDLSTVVSDGPDSDKPTNPVTVKKDGQKLSDWALKDAIANGTLTASGQYTFSTTDSVGHTSADYTLVSMLTGEKNNNLIVDTQKPTETLKLSDTAEWLKQSPELTINSKDDTGADKVQIIINHNVVETLDASKLKSKEFIQDLTKYEAQLGLKGKITVEVKTIDIVGNSVTDSVSYNLDKEAPTTATPVTQVHANYNKVGYLNTDIPLKIPVDDQGGSGLKNVKLFDSKGVLVNTYTTKDIKDGFVNATITKSGAYKYQVTDNAGNTSAMIDLVDSKGNTSYVIEKDKPVIKVNTDDVVKTKKAKISITDANYVQDGKKVDYTTKTFKVNGKDVTATFINESPAGVFNFEVPVTPEPNGTIEVTTMDLPGNSSSASAKYTLNNLNPLDPPKVDPPYVEPTPDPDPTPAPEEGHLSVDWNAAKMYDEGYYSEDRTAIVTVKLKSFDTKESEIKVDGQVVTVDWVKGEGDNHTATIKFADEGKHSLDVKYLDKSINSGDFVIDKTFPQVNVTGIEQNGLYHGNAIPVINATDANFKELEWSITGAALPTAHWADTGSAGTFGGAVEAPKADPIHTSRVYAAEPVGDSRVTPKAALDAKSAALDGIGGSKQQYPGDGGWTSDDFKDTGWITGGGSTGGGSTGGDNSGDGGNTSNPTPVDPTTTTDPTNPGTTTDPKDSVNDDPNNNAAGTFTASGKSTDGQVTLPDIPHERQYDGGYLLTVSAIDKAGNRTTMTMPYGVRRFGTSFTSTFTSGGNLLIDDNTNNLGLRVHKVNSEKHIKLKKDVDYKITSVDKTPDNKYMVNYTIKTKKLTDGNYEGIFSELANNKDIGTVNFIVDTHAPKITAKQLAENGFIKTKDSKTIKVNLKDAMSADYMSLDVKVDGKQVTATTKDNKNFTFDVHAKKDPQKIELIGSDSYGNKAHRVYNNVQVGEKQNTVKAWLYRILAILVIGLTGYYGYDKYQEKKNKKDSSKKSSDANNGSKG